MGKSYNRYPCHYNYNSIIYLKYVVQDSMKTNYCNHEVMSLNSIGPVITPSCVFLNVGFRERCQYAADMWGHSLFISENNDGQCSKPPKTVSRLEGKGWGWGPCKLDALMIMLCLTFPFLQSRGSHWVTRPASDDNSMFVHRLSTRDRVALGGHWCVWCVRACMWNGVHVSGFGNVPFIRSSPNTTTA